MSTFFSRHHGGGAGGLVAPQFRRRRNEGGFTFIEVLVALAIFAFSGLVLASAYMNVLSAQHAALQRDANAADCRLVREALCAEPTLTKVTDWNELELPDQSTARWRATVTPTNVADLFDVSLEIDLPKTAGRKEATIITTCRLLRPTWSQPADRETLRAAARSQLAKRTYQ
jgi:general secretion pathway protein I